MTAADAPRLSAGIVVVRCIGGRYHYLLLRAYRYWDFPKGEVAADESPIEAAKREVREETGLGDLDFSWGEDYTQTPPYRRQKVARYYLALSRTGDVSLPVNPDLGRPEHHAYRWADRAAAGRLVGPRVRAVLDWASRRTGERC